MALTTLAEMKRVRKKISDISAQHGKPLKKKDFDWAHEKPIGPKRVKESKIMSHLVSLDPRFKFFEMAGGNTISFEMNKEEIRLSVYVAKIEHEIAHWVEMKDPKRWLLPNWDLESYRVHEDNSVWWDRSSIASSKSFFVALVREIRVRAIQSHLLEEDDPKEMTRNRLFDSAWIVSPELPFGKFTHKSEVKEWAGFLFDQTFKDWDKDRIEHEFKIRLNAAQEFMETKEEEKC